MEPWYRLVTPRKEVREGRSFNPDEFAIEAPRCLKPLGVSSAFRARMMN
jgi:hypothetical protein